MRTLNDDYEFRVKLIFVALRGEHAEDNPQMDFRTWLDNNPQSVANAFLEDVETYMGIPEGE